MALRVSKAHAYGNDFLYVERSSSAGRDWVATARALCDRQRGIGADGLIVFERLGARTRMVLINADGSPAEISGNGVRGLGAILARQWRLAGQPVPETVEIDTDAGTSRLRLLEATDTTFTFRSAMPPPEDIRQDRLDVQGESIPVVMLRIGNPQCVVIEPALDDARYRRLGPLLEWHEAFPKRTNVSFARIASPSRIEILIWERGVGPTLASGTGACGAAVAAMTVAGCAREVEVESPGGTQRVAWNADGLFLTGWAKVVWQGEWLD